ncbi:hypothetical protein SynPROS91_01976 [Synechococcus sp. PROS-9-1]|nr:hypothetical protein SynPROS91_01976 [Synechococcus sp. PROS-9-1]
MLCCCSEQVFAQLTHVERSWQVNKQTHSITVAFGDKSKVPSPKPKSSCNIHAITSHAMSQGDPTMI